MEQIGLFLGYFIFWALFALENNSCIFLENNTQRSKGPLKGTPE